MLLISIIMILLCYIINNNYSIAMLLLLLLLIMIMISLILSSPHCQPLSLSLLPILHQSPSFSHYLSLYISFLYPTRISAISSPISYSTSIPAFPSYTVANKSSTFTPNGNVRKRRRTKAEIEIARGLEVIYYIIYKSL